MGAGVASVGVPVPLLLLLRVPGVRHGGTTLGWQRMVILNTAHTTRALLLSAFSRPAAWSCLALQAVSFAAEQLLAGGSEDDPEAAADAAAEAAESFLLGGCRGEALLAALQDSGPALSDAPEGIRQQWEAAGMLSALTVLDQLQGLGYRLEQGVTVAAVSGLVWV